MSIDSPFELAQIDRLLTTTTKAVRRRLDLTRPVARDVVVECIRLASYAPNASNAQEWHWVVVDDPEQRARVGEQYRTTTVPVVSQMLARKEADGDGHLIGQHAVPTSMEPGMFASIYPAVWSFLLALRSRGLGSVLTTAHQLDQPAMAELLGIPTTWFQTALLPVAYTTGGGFVPSPRAPVDDSIVWNRFG